MRRTQAPRIELQRRLKAARGRLGVREIAGLGLAVAIGLAVIAYLAVSRSGSPSSLAPELGIPPFYLEAKVVVLNNPATGNVREAASHDAVRWWYADANHWRWEVDITDDSTTSDTSTTAVASADASYVGVADGRQVWVYDEATQTYQTFKPSQYATTLLPIVAILGPVELGDLFDQWRQAGIEVMSQSSGQLLQREADVYEYGPTWEATGSKGTQSGGVGKVWVDVESGLIVRNVVDDGPSRQYTDASVTLLDQEPNLDPSLFRFTPPDNATKVAPTAVVP